MQSTLKYPFKLEVESKEKTLSFDLFETQYGYHYSTGLYHAFIEGSPGAWELKIQETIKSDCRKTAKLFAKGPERARLEFLLVDILYPWHQK